MNFDILDALRAKDSKSEYYLLKDHIKETINRAKQLKDFIDKNRDAIGYDCFKDGNYFKHLVMALFIHDLGKIDINFQSKLFTDEEKKCEQWKIIKEFFSGIKYDNFNIRHEILSIVWSTFLLGNTEWEKKVRTAILLHHYNKYYIEEKNFMYILYEWQDEILNYLRFLSTEKTKSLVKMLINELKEEFVGESLINSVLEYLDKNIDKNFSNIDRLLKGIEKHEDDLNIFCEIYDISNDNPDYDFLVFLGCLRRCDYSASGAVRIEERSIKEIIQDLDAKIVSVLKKKNMLEKNELWQNLLLNKIYDNKNLVLIAPTGSGKTEFALLWNKRIKRKLIYTLPLRVALNDLFIRFSDAEEGYFGKELVDILHSTSFIEYIKHYMNSDIDIDAKLSASKLFSSPVLLSTPDQVFLTSLNYYGSDKILAIYPLSSIIIDEIQTYTPEMAAITIKTLKIINSLKGKILIMTATLPPYYKKYFNELDFEIQDIKELDIKDKIKNYNLKRHKVVLKNESMFNYQSNEQNGDRLEINSNPLNILKEQIDKHKRILIIVNNVSKAIKLYKKLSNKYDNIWLLHSRLIEKEKSHRINEIKSRLENGNEKIILVATQIVEASVNIDFDILLTEISTIDSQIQRWGRIYRNRESDYSLEEPNIIIFNKIDKGTIAIYDKNVVEKTLDVLKEYENKLLSYEDEREMIEQTFNKHINGNTLNEYFEYEIDKNLEYLKYFSVEKKNEAQKLFRKIAGIRAVLPQIMERERAEKESDQILQIFAKIIMNEKELSWEAIIKRMSHIKEVSKWELKRYLYEYSVDIPMFYFDNHKYEHFNLSKFKGFLVITNNDQEKIDSCKEYGIDELYETIDDEEMKQHTYDNII